MYQLDLMKIMKFIGRIISKNQSGFRKHRRPFLDVLLPWFAFSLFYCSRSLCPHDFKALQIVICRGNIELLKCCMSKTDWQFAAIVRSGSIFWCFGFVGSFWNRIIGNWCKKISKDHILSSVLIKLSVVSYSWQSCLNACQSALSN